MSLRGQDRTFGHAMLHGMEQRRIVYDADSSMTGRLCKA